MKLTIVSACLAMVACGGPTVGNNGGADGGGSGDDGAGGPIPGAVCAAPMPPTECGAACDGATPCPAGFYCASGVCTADCTADGGQCPAGQECGPDGRCVADCPSVQFTPTRVTPHVEFLIDQSGSMNADFMGKTRWAAVRDALVGTGGVVETLEDSVVFGATLYTSRDGNAPCPRLTSTARAIGNLDGIRTMIDANTWDDETPTGESLAAVAQAFPAPSDGAPRIIVVATDGEPDTCAQPNPNPTAAAQQATIDAASAAFAAGISVYILSVGADVSNAHLQDVANAGVGQPISTGTAPYYRGNNQAELTAAFQAIINGAISCDLELDGRITPDAGPTGDVRLDGTPLTYGTEWTIVDEDTIRILGAACDQLKTQAPQLSATFPCGSVIL
ncbi:MAG: vWA domain-containing protein [Kofleriaceae bacterium]|nr:vWA domain-containing protein [Kofleriaceae bacterium]